MTIHVLDGYPAPHSKTHRAYVTKSEWEKLKEFLEKRSEVYVIVSWDNQGIHLVTNLDLLVIEREEEQQNEVRFT